MTTPIKIDVSLKKSAGAEEVWVVIDNRDIQIDNAGKGRCDTDDRPIHSYVIWLEGPPGSTVDFEFKNGPKSLVKNKLTVSVGQRQQVQTNSFGHA